MTNSGTTLPATDYFLCGWHVRSEYPLPELSPWTHPGHTPDIDLHLGEPEAISSSCDVIWPGFAIDGPAFARVDLTSICTFSIRGGQRIVLHVEPGADPLEVRNYLYGTGLGVLCHQRGVYPLHGSCLRLGDRAVIFSGNSGAGKSTLAAALTHRGHTMLSDDVCALDPGPGGWSVRPAFPRVKLLPASLDALPGLQGSALHASLQGKYHFRFEHVSAFSRESTPLAAVYFLERGDDGEHPSIRRIRGLDAVALLQQQVFRHHAGRVLGRTKEIFTATANIASNVPVYVLRRGFDFNLLRPTIDLLEQQHDAVLV